jgi:hypothetical protein
MHTPKYVRGFLIIFEACVCIGSLSYASPSYNLKLKGEGVS